MWRRPAGGTAAQAKAAEVSAEVAKAVAQRDAALDRAPRCRGPESMINQFKVLSADNSTVRARLPVPGRRTAQGDRAADDPVRKASTGQLEAHRGGERAGHHVAELRTQVSYVQQTGEPCAGDRCAGDCPCQAAVRGSWERPSSSASRAGRMIERCDFDLQYTPKPTIE